jgi:hypothetical protein
MPRTLLLANPENRRAASFLLAAQARNLDTTVVPWLDALREPARLIDALHPPSLLRVESPGENFDVERALLAWGAPDHPRRPRLRARLPAPRHLRRRGPAARPRPRPHPPPPTMVRRPLALLGPPRRRPARLPRRPPHEHTPRPRPHDRQAPLPRTPPRARRRGPPRPPAHLVLRRARGADGNPRLGPRLRQALLRLLRLGRRRLLPAPRPRQRLHLGPARPRRARRPPLQRPARPTLRTPRRHPRHHRRAVPRGRPRRAVAPQDAARPPAPSTCASSPSPDNPHTASCASDTAP